MAFEDEDYEILTSNFKMKRMQKEIFAWGFLTGIQFTAILGFIIYFVLL